MTIVPESLLVKAEDREARLRDIIANALKALDEGRYGDVRRLLKTGSDRAIIPQTGVIARNGPR